MASGRLRVTTATPLSCFSRSTELLIVSFLVWFVIGLLRIRYDAKWISLPLVRPFAKSGMQRVTGFPFCHAGAGNVVIRDLYP